MMGTDLIRQESQAGPRLTWAERTRGVLLVGVCAGVAYFVLNLVLFFPSEELRLIGSGLLRANLFIYSLSVWVCSFAGLCVLVEVLMLPLSLRQSAEKRSGLRRFILLFVVIIAFVTGHAVWAYYVRTPPFQQRQIILKDLRAVLVAVTLGSALLALTGSLVASCRRVRRPLGRAPGTRGLLGAVGFCLAYLVIANLVGLAGDTWNEQKGRPSAGDSPIVMFGLDCGSWNVMLPYLENGDLPCLKRIMEEGSYGYLDAFGIAGPELTPPSWTTIATGQHMEKHGIRRFGQLSSEWRAAPFWSILSRAGKTVGIVDWVCAWPPFKVNGMFISNASPSRQARTYFSPGFDSLGAVADSIIAASYRDSSTVGDTPAGSPGSDVGFLTRSELTGFAQDELGFISQIDREVVSQMPLDLVSYYCYSTDVVQHRFWAGTEPPSSGHGDWGQGHRASADRDMVRWVWMAADTFLANLVARYGEDARYLVVSDHGARPVESRTAIFGMNALLEEMGYLRMEGGTMDTSASVCFVKRASRSYSRFHLRVNSADRANAGIDPSGSRSRTLARIGDELESIRVMQTGKRIFERVDVSPTADSEQDADIVVYAGKDILAMPDRTKTIVVGGKEINLESLLSPHPWLAQHRARGIILAKGPGVRHRFCGSWMMVDPYISMFPYLREVIRATARLDPLLRRLHVLDRATTADVAPTLLYLADVPVAEDMDGRVLTELIDGGLLRARPIKKVATYEVGNVVDVDTGTVDREQIKKTLKALGYLQ